MREEAADGYHTADGAHEDACQREGADDRPHHVLEACIREIENLLYRIDDGVGQDKQQQDRDCRRHQTDHDTLDDERHADKGVCRADALHDADLEAVGEHGHADGVADDEQRNHRQRQNNPQAHRRDEGGQAGELSRHLAVGGDGRDTLNLLDLRHGLVVFGQIVHHDAVRIRQRVIVAGHIGKDLFTELFTIRLDGFILINKLNVGDVIYIQKLLALIDSLELRQVIIQKNLGHVGVADRIDDIGYINGKHDRRARQHQTGDQNADGRERHQAVMYQIFKTFFNKIANTTHTFIPFRRENRLILSFR